MKASHLFPLVVVFLDVVCCQQDVVFNTNLDILLLLDQQRTRLTLTGEEIDPEYCEKRPGGLPDYCYQTFDFFENCSNYRSAYDDVKNWMQSFFDKEESSKTQFAMIFGCNSNTGGIMHKFKDVNFQKKMPKLLEDGKRGIRTECQKNFYMMLHLANDYIFTTDSGHRPESTAIAIVLSDCVQEKLPPSEVSKTKAEYSKFFQQTKGQLYFICYVEFREPFRNYFKVEIKRFMNETLEILRTNNQTNQSMIYLDGNNVNIGQRLDQLLPKRSVVRSTNCNQTWVCGICSGNGTCVAHCNITTHSWPTGNGTNCTEQAPMIQNCTCPTTTPQPTEPPSYWPIILGFGILLLILVSVIIGVWCIRAKSSRKKRAKAMAVGVRMAPVKKAGIAVDLSKEHSMTNNTGKGSSVRSMSMVGSKVKPVTMKGSTVKSMSKRRSVVKSLAKMGSLSKAADESGKSVSKPKGKESKSKTSKFVAGKDVKSIGKSKKSVASNSFAAKSRMKSKKPVAN